MRRWILVVFIMSWGLLPHSRAAAQSPDARSELVDNAAMKYWQAFALLPLLDKDQEKLLQDWNKVSLDEAALNLIERSRMSRVYLHRGAKLPRCDWSLDYEDGIGLHLSHCPNSLTLARLVALHARHEFELGHWLAGWEEVKALLKLGRHVEMGPQFVVRWVGYRIETYAIEAATPYLPELKPFIPEAVPSVLDSLPVGPTLDQVVLGEKQTGLAWLIRQREEAEQRKKGSWRVVWNEYLDVPWQETEYRDLVHSVNTFEQAVKLLEDLLPFYDQACKVDRPAVEGF